MRLTNKEVAAIKAAAADIFGPDAVVRLFGSRIDDRRTGGDIDLAIEIDGPLPGYEQRSLFVTQIECITDDRKIDLFFMKPCPSASGFEAIVRRDGIVLS